MPVITLSTDTGSNDYLAGAVKGQLYSAVPSCTVSDISHELSQNNYQQAAYICSNAFRFYPAGTFHVVIINFFERASRQLLIAADNNQFIICPDNGILTMILGRKPHQVFALPVQQPGTNTLLQYTAVIASSIQRIVNGELLTRFATPINNIEEKYPMRSASGPDWIDTQIIFIDRFENVVLNLTRDEFEELRRNRPFRIVLMRNSEFITSISEQYAAVQPGENLACFNSAGYLELAINKGNMAGLFGLQRFTSNASAMQNRLLYQTVRIMFE